LLDHIHGVDLDSQAVEVTKLNLLLKCLEGETSQTLGFEAKLFKERALPDLGNNILCGNSLIGTDIIGTDAWKEMSEEERTRVNPFDYERAFPKVFKGKGGGFDAVIGNPPYGASFGDTEDSWFSKHFATYQGAQDVYVLFMEQA
ncbi:MAG: Eco57I restriction-modification methylase domain-containing protein, partial [Phycisphaerae bacterium]